MTITPSKETVKIFGAGKYIQNYLTHPPTRQKMSKLHEKVMRMERQHWNMKTALSNIAKIAHYHSPLSEAARSEIVATATKAVQEADDE